MSGEYKVGSLGDLIAQSCGVENPEFDTELASFFKPQNKVTALPKKSVKRLGNELALPRPAAPKVKAERGMRNREAKDIRLGAKAKFANRRGGVVQAAPITLAKAPLAPVPALPPPTKRAKVKPSQPKDEEHEAQEEEAESAVPDPGAEIGVRSEVKRKTRGKKVGGEGVKKTVEESNAPKDKDPELESRTVYVGNVPKDVGKKQLLKLFRQFGDIETLRYRCAAPDKPKRLKKVAINKKELHPDRDSVAAFIRYKSREEAEEAMKTGNGLQVQDHHLIVDLADHSAKKDNKKAIFVGNLHLKMQDEELRSFFEDCGKVEGVRVIRDRNTGMGKGFGYVNFQENSSVELALQKDGTELKNRTLRISRCVKKLKNKDDPNRPTSSAKKRSQGKKQRSEVMDFGGDTTAEIGKFKRSSKKPNLSDAKKARVAKQLAGTPSTATTAQPRISISNAKPLTPRQIKRRERQKETRSNKQAINSGPPRQSQRPERPSTSAGWTPKPRQPQRSFGNSGGKQTERYFSPRQNPRPERSTRQNNSSKFAPTTPQQKPKKIKTKPRHRDRVPPVVKS